MVYDALGRMTSRTDADGTSTWEYDTAATGKGKIARVTGPMGYLREHTYDPVGRPASVTTTIEFETYTMATTYDQAGRVDTVTYPDGFQVKNDYNPLGYLKEVRDPAGPAGTYFWRAINADAEGKVTEEILGNGLTTLRHYDERNGHLLSINTGGGSSSVQNLAYVWDSIGNLMERHDNGRDCHEAFEYDDLNRLTKSTLSACNAVLPPTPTEYGYDEIGNLTYKSDVGTYFGPRFRPFRRGSRGRG